MLLTVNVYNSLSMLPVSRESNSIGLLFFSGDKNEMHRLTGNVKIEHELIVQDMAERDE